MVAVCRDVRDHELRRRARVRADRERERALHRMPVDRDRAPVDEVPALRQVRLERDDQRVRVRRRARAPAPVVSWWASLSVTEMIAKRGSTASSKVSGDVGGGALRIDARRRERLDQVGVRRRRRRQPASASTRRAATSDADRPRGVMRAASSSAAGEQRDAAEEHADAPRTSATIVSSDVPPPPSELFASIVGAGSRRRLGAGPVDDRAVRVGLLRPGRCRCRSSPAARGTGRASPPRSARARPSRSPSGSRRCRPSRSAAARAVQPGLGTNESIEKPFGTVSTIFVVSRSPSRSGRRGCRAGACSRARRAG